MILVVMGKDKERGTKKRNDNTLIFVRFKAQKIFVLGFANVQGWTVRLGLEYSAIIAEKVRLGRDFANSERAQWFAHSLQIVRFAQAKERQWMCLKHQKIFLPSVENLEIGIYMIQILNGSRKVGFSYKILILDG